jgi:hypothetical protein
MKALLLSLFFALAAFAAFADGTNRTFYVRVIVAGVETNSVSSYVKRELRGLNDVNLTDVDYRSTLSIVVAPLKETKTEVIRGYVASWAVIVMFYTITRFKLETACAGWLKQSQPILILTVSSLAAKQKREFQPQR